MKLSVCIPTYNRDQLLLQTVDSLLNQKNRYDFEIVISDNCSTDQTESLIKSLQLEHENIVYVKNPTNIGPDLNYINAIEKSSSEYCWFMGSDDIAESFAIEEIYQSIFESNADVLLFNRTDYTFDMSQSAGIHRFLSLKSARILNFSNTYDLNIYKESFIDLGGAFSYLSSIVIKKSSWSNNSVHIESHVGSAYLHVSRIFQMLKANGLLYFNPRPIIKNRMGNDHFGQNGYVHRLSIDFNYFKITNDVFAKDYRHQYFYNALARYFCSFRRLMAYKYWSIYYEGSEGFNKLFGLYDQNLNSKWIKSFKRLIFKYIPFFVLKIIYRGPYLALIKKSDLK